MKKLLPIIAFLVTFAIGGGAGAIAMKPAAAPHSPVDSAATHAPTPDAPAHPEPPAYQPPLTVYDPAVGSDDPHVADPPHPSATTPNATTPNAITTSSASSGGQLTSAASSSATNRDGTPMTIESLVRTQTGATVTMRPDGTIGPDQGTFQPLPDYARMARLLTRMAPREAARTVEQLSGDEAARALAQMNDKSAAAVLGQLSPEKAAALLQAVLALVPKPAVP